MAAANDSPAPEREDSPALDVRPFPVPPASATPEPPAKKAMSPERLAAELRRGDRILMVIVLALAFLLASFTVRNSDYWMHLATGRALVEGRYTFGADPFAHTTAGVYWANNTWLSDLLLYGLSRMAGEDASPGGALVVIVKALLVTLLVWVLLCIRRPGQSAWLPVVCVALTTLALGPHLILRPTCVSVLFLGVTLWVLQRESKSPRTAETTGWRVLLTAAPERLGTLPVLFALWVNLDSWFLLGPLTVGLYLLGETLARDGDPAERRGLRFALVGGLAACLLNPHFFRAFALPPDLAVVLHPGALREDALFQSLFLSPFSEGYFAAGLGTSPVGLAYFVLLGLGLLSFALDRAEWRGWRVALWATFAGLSAWHWRFVPFFAIVAGPITALNLQDYAIHRFGVGVPATPAARRWALGGRALTLLLGLVLLILAVPGWLHPRGDSPGAARRVEWRVEAAPAQRRAARFLADLRDRGLLAPEARGFNFVPDLANYCAWYSPGEKGFFDFRYSLFMDVAADYYTVRRALSSIPLGDEDQEVFRARGITHVILVGSSPSPAFFQMLSDRRQWTPLYFDGRTMIFAWHDPRQPGPAKQAHLDLGNRAFGPQADRAPADGPARLPRVADWWERQFNPPVSRPLDADLAMMALEYSQAETMRRQREYLTDWARHGVAALVGTPALSHGPFATPTALAGMVHRLRSLPEPGAPASLLVALRAARRAVAENPDDVGAYAALAETLHTLRVEQEDRWTRSVTPELTPRHLQQLRELLRQGRPEAAGLVSPWLRRAVSGRQLLRQAQLIVALRHILVLKKDTPEAHETLARLFWQMGYFDLSIEHGRTALQLSRAAPPPTDAEKRRLREARMEEYAQLLDARAKEVKELQTDFELSAARLPPVKKAVQAILPFGLAKQALAQFDQALANHAPFSPDEVGHYLFLLLTTGQVETLHDGASGKPGVLLSALRDKLGSEFGIYQAFLAAAVGDYATARQSLDRFAAEIDKQEKPSFVPGLQRGLLIHAESYPLARLLLVRQLYEGAWSQVLTSVTQLREEAEFHVLRGLVALDEGDTAAARSSFRRALSPAGVPVFFESKPLTQHYLELLEQHTGK